MRITENRVYFWSDQLGNWTRVKGGILIPAEYSMSGKEFRLPTSEHIFMYLKALYFKDQEIAKQIIETPSPKEAKALGRKIKNFWESSWIKYRELAMWISINLKYDSDPSFRKYLHSPKFRGKIFVEANPYDKIWSCGYLEDDPRCDMPEETWPGLNLLGKLLTKLRNERELKKLEDRL